MKKLNLGCILLIVWFMLMLTAIGVLAFFLQSCSASKKNYQKTATKTDSSHISTTISQINIDSSAKNKYHLQDWYLKNTIYEFDTTGLQVYVRGDGTPTTAPTVINDTTAYDYSGPYYGHLKRITVHEEGTREKTAEETTDKKSTASEEKKETEKKVVRQTVTQKAKEKIKIPWLLIILITVAAVLIYFRKKIPYLKNL